MNHADVVVIGLGAMGSATTFQLAKRGVKVIGIDRFSPPHVIGSTHGDTRITRQAIGEGKAYVPLVLRSHQLWREIEAESGADLFTACGGLILAAEPVVNNHQDDTTDFFTETVSAAQTYGIEHEILSTEETHARFPQFRFSTEHRGYYEPGAGFVRPEAAVGAQLDLATRFGADIRCEERVVQIEASNSGVTIHTDKNRYYAGQVIVTAGPWISQIAGSDDIARLCDVYRQALHWFEIAESPEIFGPDQMPVFIWKFGTGSEDDFYGFPAVDGPTGGLKVATGQFTNTTDPENLDRAVQPEESRTMFNRYIDGRLPLRPAVVKTARCLYTATPDHDFIIDRHPEHQNILLASPCSGHGFKHSAAIGESLAQLAIDGRSKIDLSPFALGRFRHNK